MKGRGLHVRPLVPVWASPLQVSSPALSWPGSSAVTAEVEIWSALQWQEAAVGARAVQRSAAGSCAAEGQLVAQALIAATPKSSRVPCACYVLGPSVRGLVIASHAS